MVALNAILRLVLKASSPTTLSLSSAANLSFRASEASRATPAFFAGSTLDATQLPAAQMGAPYLGAARMRVRRMLRATRISPRFPSSPPAPESGFTLIELIIVMTIIGLLAAIAVPMYVQSVRNAREAVLKEDLRTLRSCIDSYTVDKQKAPQTLDDLVQAGYLKSLPVDPFTHRSDTWVPSQDDAMMSLDQTESGINDVHSGAQGTAGDGSSYSSW